ncbi:serine protease Do [Sphingomonas kyeonggiensis]|uniref:aspartyl protease family protein n=1 Tax=Sphingomonas kyeonggiensis TaxID=1268553 RepID=UPI0027821F50|nr:aspartyl protease family protein [Sphingomonas kyeonggiensis]MDQ0251071.1 serine protease Do [Sphingomonas kyeonggiensis]
MIDRRRMIGGSIALAGGAALPGTAALAAPRQPVINPIRLSGNRVVIDAMVNGKGPYSFILDTGGTVSFIEKEFAKGVPLASRDGRPIVGVGHQVASHDWYVANEVRLASGVRFRNMQFAGIAKHLGQQTVGSFGAGLFTTYDSDLDFVKGEWRAYTDGRGDFDGLTLLPSQMLIEPNGRRLLLDTSIDGFAAELMVDTGAPGLSLNARSAAKSGLWESGKPYAPTRALGIGDGDGLPARIYRSGEVRFGPFTFKDELVTVDRPGSLTNGKQDGIIGLSILSQLHLTTDVSRGKLYAAPNGRQAEDRRYPLSGLWIDEVKGRPTVTDVGIGSPAAKAGLQQGDVLLGGDLAAMVRAIGGGPGRQVSLRVQRGNAQQDVSYALAPWL